MVEATIKLTKTMLDKSIIDANKTVQQFLDKHWEDGVDNLGYDAIDPKGFVIFCNVRFDDSELETEIRFYKTNRGDRRLSIKNIKKYADVGDTISIVYEGALAGYAITKERTTDAA